VNYKTIEDLNEAIKALVPKLPADLDLIVGIPRSGLLAASLLALHLNLPITDVDGLCERRVLQTGLYRKFGKVFDFSRCRKVLVIDDSINTGATMEKAKSAIQHANLPYKIYYTTVYASSTSQEFVDFWCEIVDQPRYFEWNVMHHPNLKRSCVDLDGIICRDPTESENDDGDRYRSFLVNAELLVRPSVEIGWIVTCRLEKYRHLTEEWLKKHGIRYTNLVMMDLPDKKARMSLGEYGLFKAKAYKSSRAILFIESSPVQAQEIAARSGKDVLCLHPSSIAANRDPKIAALIVELRNSLSTNIQRLELQIQQRDLQIKQRDLQIQQIQQNIPMRFADGYQRRIERLLPPDTRRRRCYELGLSGIRVILTEGWKSFFRKTWKHLTRRLLLSCSELVYALKGLRAACSSPHDNRKGGAITLLYSPFSYDNPEPGMIVDSLKKKGVSVHVAKIHNLFPLIKSIGEQGKPHVVHLHWVHFFILGKSRIITLIKSISFLSELLILKLCGIKLVWTIHNIFSHESRYPRWELFINRLIARLCNELIVHTNSIKLEVRSKYKLSNSKSIGTVCPLNYASSYENTMSQSEARKVLTLKPKDFVFLYFGLVRAYKGVNDLIERFNELEADGETKNIKLLIVGKPLNEKIHDNVLSRCAINRNIMPVLKWVDDKEIQIYMNAANIAVFPFENILNSGSVVLAMSFRNPVIAPAMGSIPEILDSKGGFMYKASEKEGLLEAMMQALNCKPDELKAMGDRNFEKVKEFTPETLAARTLEIYRRCLRSQK
jgi:orotate phosphoribosyltransferase